MVDVSMLTYEWFVPTQGPNFPGFAFPGARYHPNEPGGFSMRELLDANFRADPDAPVFLAEGGTSTIRRTRGTTTSNRGAWRIASFAPIASRRFRRKRS